VDVQVDQATEPLHERDRAGQRCADAAGARDAALPRGDRAHDETSHPARPRRVAREPQAQRLGYGQHPLPIRRLRQHAIDEVRRGVGHASRGARRADAASLARERDEDLVVARLAPHAGEAVGEHPAAQILGELPIDVAWQAASVGIAELGDQGLRVARDQLVQHGVLRCASLVAVSQRLSGRAGRSFVESAREHPRAL